MYIMVPLKLLQAQDCDGLDVFVKQHAIHVNLIHFDPEVDKSPTVVSIPGLRRGDMVLFDDEPRFQVLRSGRLLNASELDLEAVDHYRQEARLLVEALHETAL